MALKFADTAKPMGDFPVAEAVDIELTKDDGSKKSLQNMYDDGELGGGEGLPLPEQANMVMMTYENEDGDLDWKQSLLKTVEKVDEIPTTFEDKVYVVDIGNPYTTIPEAPDSTAMTLDDISDILKLAGEKLDPNFLTYIREERQPEKNIIALYLNYNDDKYNYKITNNNGSQPTTYEHIHLIGYDSGSWFFDDSEHYQTKKWVTWNSLKLEFITIGTEIPTQVYASEIELATKEYADTHGAGAQVYTQAEWDALPVKPPAGTQVIISDDTSGGSSSEVIVDFNDPIDKWLADANNSPATAKVAEANGIAVGFIRQTGTSTTIIHEIDENGKNIVITGADIFAGGCYVNSVTFPVKKGRKYYVERATGSIETYGTLKFYPFKSKEVELLKAEDKYSTSETVVSEWIDGKPIYRKVIQKSFTATNSWEVFYTDSNVETLIKYEPLGWTAKYYPQHKFESNNISVSIETGTTNFTGAIIEYTKK